MPNRLASETSPYLIQHADNPVDWYPWGEEALALADRENRPILLSIGYAACHWCHVMAHESFEDEETAALMNERFVNVKVDREERPDLDSIYMEAVVAMTGRGGWPMTVILTPGGKPFYGGTYFPPAPRQGMPSFRQVLEAVSEAWNERRDDVLENAGLLTQQLSASLDISVRPGSVSPSLIEKAVEGIGQQYEPLHGGFGRAPKFPQAMTIELLLRYTLRSGDSHALKMAEHTLNQMARGGMYDQLGGGFARYSTDDKWLVPHFEKMLYDNALLARVYLHAWQMTGTPLYRRVLEETLEWVLREMTHSSGGFFSSLDADSEGAEGTYYVWSDAEIRDALGDDAEAFVGMYGVSEAGNWEGSNVLHVLRSADELADELGVPASELREIADRCRRRLLDLRDKRACPGLDDKVITSWNGQMLAALAEAGRVLGRADLVEAAVANATFLYDTMRDGEGRLQRTWTASGGARLNAYLSDHADLAEGLIALYRSTYDRRWLDWAHELAETMVDRFGDADGVGFFDTSDDHEQLIRRPKDVQDNAVPCGNAMAATVLLQLSLYSGDGALWDQAAAAVSGMTGLIERAPTAFAQWLQAAWFMVGDARELAVVGDKGDGNTKALLAVVDQTWRPELVVAVGDGASGDAIPLLANRQMLDGRATAYLCRGFACRAPTTDPGELAQQLDAT